MNLEFFIGLRNKIEHRFLPELDIEIFGECQAMLMNFETLLSAEFGTKQALVGGLSVRKFVTSFKSSLSEDIQSDGSYSFKVFLVPKVGVHAKSSDLAVEFVKYDPSKPEEMKQYERVVALIKPKQVSIANLGCLKAGQVVKQVSAQLGRKFTLNSHMRCWKHFNTRPARGGPAPEACDNRYCYYDGVHQDYVYTSAWVSFLLEKLADAPTYAMVVGSAAPPVAAVAAAGA